MGSGEPWHGLAMSWKPPRMKVPPPLWCSHAAQPSQCKKDLESFLSKHTKCCSIVPLIKQQKKVHKEQWINFGIVMGVNSVKLIKSWERRASCNKLEYFFFHNLHRSYFKTKSHTGHKLLSLISPIRFWPQDPILKPDFPNLLRITINLNSSILNYFSSVLVLLWFMIPSKNT